MDNYTPVTSATFDNTNNNNSIVNATKIGDDVITTAAPTGATCLREHAVIYWVFACVYTVGIVGNLVSLLAFHRSTKPTSVTCMIWLLKSLAVTDSLYLFLELAVDTIGKWSIGGEWSVSLFHGVHHMAKIAQYASVWHLVVIAGVRYLAICHVFQARKVCTIRRMRVLILITWLLAVLLESPNILWRLSDGDFDPSETFWMVYELYVVNGFVFVLPFGVLLVFTYYVLREMWYCRLELLTHNEEVNESRSNERLSITKLLVVILVVFFVTYMPYPLPTIDRYLCGDYYTTIRSCVVKPLLTIVYYKTQLISSSVNFFIYYVFLKSFRRQVVAMCCGCGRRFSYVRESFLLRRTSTATRRSCLDDAGTVAAGAAAGAAAKHEEVETDIAAV